jgi:hypothetical protein
MKRLFPLACAIAVALVAAGPASAAGSNGKLRADPFAFDPDKLGIIVSKWQPGTGLSDAGNSNHGLALQKNGPTSAFAAAGAQVLGVAGMTGLDELGFDYRNGGHCTGGSPRYNVDASDGFHFVGGCGNGTQTPSGESADWTRVRFDAQNPSQAFPPVSPTATINSITLIADEEGQTVVDNLAVNSTLIGKPGNSK